MKIYLLIATVLACLINTNSLGQNKMDPSKLQADFDYLVNELREQHQGLYQYESKKKVDTKLDSLRNTLNKPLSKEDFYKLIRKTIYLTNEGHTYADLPKIQMVKLGLSKSFIPLKADFCDDRLLVKQYYGKKEMPLKAGMEILSINGYTVKEIREAIFDYIVTDGFNETSKYVWSSGGNFPLLYRLVFGATKNFELLVKGYEDKEASKVQIAAIRVPQFKAKNKQLAVKSCDYQQFKMELLNDSIAYLCIPSFASDAKVASGFEAFYEQSFKTIKAANIKHLILDVQYNGGGEEGNENLLYSYLSSKVVQKYKAVTMSKKAYEKRKGYESVQLDKWEIKEGASTAYRGDFANQSDYYSELGYEKPDSSIVFTGKVYLLTGGKTFSGGAEFASLFRLANRGLVVGEETGGTYEGNVSGYGTTIKLPNSKIKVSIPIVHFQMNVSPTLPGRGVMPDYTVAQTWEDYLKGENSKLKFVLDSLIMKEGKETENVVHSITE